MEKTEKFFERLSKNSVSKTLSWFLIGLFLFLSLIASLIPAQEIFSGAEDAATIMPGMLVMFTIVMARFRVDVYRQYTENQKSRLMSEILQYHPISQKAIRKLKKKTMTTFLAKVTGVELVLQLIVSFIAYKSISWLNFFYIIVFVFVFPVVAEIVFDAIVEKLHKDIE